MEERSPHRLISDCCGASQTSLVTLVELSLLDPTTHVLLSAVTTDLIPAKRCFEQLRFRQQAFGAEDALHLRFNVAPGGGIECIQQLHMQ